MSTEEIENIITHYGIHIENAQRTDNGRGIHYEFLNHHDAAFALSMMLIHMSFNECPNIELYGNMLNITNYESGNSGL